MRYKLIFFWVSCLLYVLPVSQVSAQYLEAGVFVGAANYRGELADRLYPSEFNAAYGMTMRYNFSQKFSARANLMSAYLSGKDANSLTDASQRERNLSFRADVLELSVQGEYSPLGYDILDGKVSTPYIFTGVAASYFNPQAELNGVWYDLQPLTTEGVSYSKVAFAIPMGIGFRFSLGRRMNLGVEFGARRTFTDYLDDVSGAYTDMESMENLNPVAAKLAFRQLSTEPAPNPMGEMRGNPNNKDWYFIGGINLSFNLTDQYGMEWDKRYRIYDEQ